MIFWRRNLNLKRPKMRRPFGGMRKTLDRSVGGLLRWCIFGPTRSSTTLVTISPSSTRPRPPRNKPLFAPEHLILSLLPTCNDVIPSAVSNSIDCSLSQEDRHGRNFNFNFVWSAAPTFNKSSNAVVNVSRRDSSEEKNLPPSGTECI